MFGLFALAYNVLAPYPALLDAIKLGLVGLFLDQARRILQAIWVATKRGLELKVGVNDSDDAYDWLYHYLSKHCMDPSPPSSRELWVRGDSILQILLEEVWPTGRVPPRDVQVSVLKKRHWYEEHEMIRQVEEKGGRVETKMSPSIGTTHYLRFQGYTIRFRVHQSVEEWGYKKGWITVSYVPSSLSMFAPHSLFTDLISEAHREFLVQDHGKLRIFTPRGRGGEDGWRKTMVKPHRPWDSVILPGSVKDDLLLDTREFLEEGAFYRKRGLPYKRGYLLYGSPGAGKSSLIAALAGELKLDVYIVNLSAKSMDDDGLSKLLHDCPARAILLMEDIDCALNDRESNDNDSDSDNDEKKKTPKDKKKKLGGVTLSGLLNALDGVASSEGRLLFCTTNHVDQIDAALSRPGRCDIWIEFTHATKSQIGELFVHFYHPGSGYLLSGNTLSTNSSFKSLSATSRMPTSRSRSPPLGMFEGADDSAEQKTGDVTLTNSPAIPCEKGCIPAVDSIKFVDMLTRLDDDPNTSIIELAMRFANIIPDYAVSVSAIQGYLMRYKRKPELAVMNAKQWVRDGYPQGPGARVKVESEHVELVNQDAEPETAQIGEDEISHGELTTPPALDATQVKETETSSLPLSTGAAKTFGKWLKSPTKKEKALSA